ncbi:MAG: hypothetical protein IH944_10610 [Armatimonadetes bacterium]|nr:hypothetical protein [Armatimonadota bacterium]
MTARLDLSDEEVAAVVQRAHEIHSLEDRLDTSESQYEQYVKVAEEMGVPRDAMMQALNERFAFLEETLNEGDFVFAKSGDGHHYVARIDKVVDSGAHVKFLNGSEAAVGLHDLRKASFTPGSSLDFLSKDYGMFIRGRCVQFNSAAQTVTVSAWGEEYTVPLHKVRIRKERSPSKFNARALILMIALSAVAGGGIGAAIMYLIAR